MAKNKVSGQGKAAKGKGKGKGKGQGKSDVGGKEEKQESGRDHKWNDDHDETQVRHILCEKHSDKENALARLKAGENFHKVASDVSEHKKSDGKSSTILPMLVKHQILTEVKEVLLPKWYRKNQLKFGDVAFTLEVSSVTDPKIGERRTDQGYHIIMVEGRRKARG